MKHRHVQTISGKGTAPGQFREELRGIAVDQANLIYAVGDSEVKVFNPDGSLRHRWRTDRRGFSVGLPVGGDGGVLVGQEGQVQRFDRDGRLLRTLADGERLGLAAAIGAVGESVLVADATNRCIRHYDQSGAYVNTIGADNKTKGFMIPNGRFDLCIDEQGVIHATNPGKHRIESYTLDGKLLGHFGRFGGTDPAGFSGCCNPTNVALTKEGRVVVTVKAPPAVKVFDREGSLLAVFGEAAFDPNCKNTDVAVDSRGNIYAVDTVRLQICVFAPVD
jgi:sugar lactone lactonase YvrE